MAAKRAGARAAGDCSLRGRISRPPASTFVISLALLAVVAMGPTAAAAAAAATSSGAASSAPATETPVVSSSSMLRRRQLESAAATTTAAAVAVEATGDVEEMEMEEPLDWGAAAGGEEGDKGWLGGRGDGAPHWPFCAWEGTLTRDISNIFALENSAAYHFMAPWMKFSLEGVPTFRISGVYPRTAFFDFSAYSRGYIKAISAIADYQIKPHWGKNPFAEPCTPEEVGGYEVYVTLHGDQGYPNEIKLLQNASDVAALSYLTPVIMRFYGADPTMDTSSPDARVWGGVQPPRVEYQESDGRWVEVPQCTHEQRDVPARVIARLYGLGQGVDTTRLPGQFSYRGDCPTRSIGNGLVPGMLLHGGSKDVIPVSFQNPHSVYAYWCMSPHVKQIQQEEFFVKLKARLPIIPRALFEGEPRIWDRQAYDTRFISITTMDLNVPHRVYDSISGIEIEQFYHTRKGDGWDRRFTIVAGLTEDGVDACGMLDRGSEIWLDWNLGDDASLREFRVPHITYRDILSAATTVPRTGRTATDVAHTCSDEEGAWNDCNNYHYAQHVMQDFYPSVEIWHCDRATGHATLLA